MNTIAKLEVTAGAAAVGIAIVIAVIPAPVVKNPAFWGWLMFVLSFSFHVFLIPTKSTPSATEPSDTISTVRKLIAASLPEITPPTLLFLGLADSLRFPSDHGAEVTRRNRDWEYTKEEWDKRARMLEKKGLLTYAGSECAQTDLGAVFVSLAVRDRHYSEVARLLRNRR